jgi:dTDP-4-dehydrorhamnose reductase
MPPENNTASQIKQDKARGATPINNRGETSNDVMFKNEVRDKIIILGNGQVGKALADLYGDKARVLNREILDLSQTEKIIPVLSRYSPRAIINAAAYTQVDRAEQEAELAHLINSVAPQYLASYCKERGIPFIHYSTDYVFSGEPGLPWVEDNPTAPLSTYGKSKVEGEKNILNIGGKYMIFRTSWVYDIQGKNFVNTMLRLGAEREELSIVDDQIGAPTYAHDIAEATIKAVESTCHMESFPSGIYHLCNSGETSWYGFAKQIFAIMSPRTDLKISTIHPIKTIDYPTPAQRPLNSRLNCSKVRDVFGIIMPHWEDALKRCLG